MATTTNYGWTTPDDTDLVKDGAAAIRTLGSSIDTTTKNLNPETTTGDIAYRSATANTNTRLAIGSTGQVLTVAGGVPSWATPASGGMTSLASGTLNTATGTLVLSSISASYNDLRLIVRDVYPATNDRALGVTVNSVADYDFFYQRGGADGFVGANASFNVIADGMADTNDENFLILDFIDYANTNSAKAIKSMLKYNSTLPRTGEIAIVEGAANTTAAIDTITLTLNVGALWGAAGTYVLYGVK